LAASGLQLSHRVKPSDIAIIIGRARVATKIEVIHASRPKLVLNPTTKLAQVVDFIAMRTGANKGTAWI
jgi:hypothetical protein